MVSQRKWLLPQRRWKKIVKMKKCQKMKMTAVEKRRLLSFRKKKKKKKSKEATTTRAKKVVVSQTKTGCSSHSS